MKQIFRHNIWIDIVSWSAFGMILFVIIPMLYPADLPWIYHLYHLILFAVLIGIYYLNIGLIIPKVIKGRINIYYVFLFLTLCILVINLMNFLENQLNVRGLVYQSLYPNEEYVAEDHKSYINYYLFFLAAVVLGVGYTRYIFKKWRKEEEITREIKAEKTKAELESLKAQINPHFFFNTLNTIYALTHSNVGKSQKAILELSKMMRYAMNEENREKVSLSEETAFIHNYLELMQYRLPENVQLTFELTDKYSHKEIAPMILLSFVENCFKHGVSTEQACKIHIQTDFEEDYFVLKTTNDWFAKRKKKPGGIGIQNTEKRLKIIYGKNYELQHQIKKNRFHSILKIKLL